jgi:hypothetical protein
MIDPAQVYFDRHSSGGSHRGGSSMPRQAVVFGPGLPRGSRATTADELARMTEEGARHRADHEAALADAKRNWAPELRRAVDDLLDHGATRIVLGDRTVDARLIRFWRGDHLLHTATRAPNGGGESLSRISRDPRRRGADVLIDYLARAASKG